MLNIEKISSNINVTEEKVDNNNISFVIEPLYRGYGNTVGNALRRVLLSSIPGAAIKGVRIDGVTNEFTTLDGVHEAITDVILNVKGIVIKAETPGEKKMTLNVTGPCVVKAKDIKLPGELVIINPEHEILTITEKRDIDMEFVVDTGEGFVVEEEIDKTGWDLNYMAVDAIYTPIKKVSYEVMDTMVGRITNFDKLTLHVETDGSIDVKNAISYAVELLLMHFNPILEIGNRMEELREKTEEIVESESLEKQNDILEMKIEELDLTVRSYNCLKKAKIENLGDLLKYEVSELLKIKNFGRKSLDEISVKLEEYNLSFQSPDGIIGEFNE